MKNAHPDILVAVDQLKRAREEMRHVLLSIQKDCNHKKVIHVSWRTSVLGSAFKARRLCLNCGLEEEADHSGFGSGDCDFKYLKTEGYHKIVSSDELYKARFPEASVNVKKL